MASRVSVRRRDVLAWATELPGAELTHPFGDDVAVMKVGGKMFVLVRLVGEPVLATLKADPDRAVELVRDHAGIEPGYHTNKRHWVSVDLATDVPGGLLRELVEDAYDLVLASLSARARFDVDPDRFPLPGGHRPPRD